MPFPCKGRLIFKILFIDGDGKNIFTELELEHCEINGYILSAVGCVDVFQ